MKPATRSKPAKSEPMEERFQRFARALMAVPKKELDKEIAKHEKQQSRKRARGKT